MMCSHQVKPKQGTHSTLKTKVALHSKKQAVKNYNNMKDIIIEHWQPPKTQCLPQLIPLAFVFTGREQTSVEGEDVINGPFISLVNTYVSS